MHLHWYQHVPFERLGWIEAWARERGDDLSVTRWHEGDAPPAPSRYDGLIIMGGPMGIYDDAAHPWLAREREAIRAAIQAGKPALGICLGSQLLADALGGRVTRNPVPEIGWRPVRFASLSLRGQTVPLPAEATVFHWHGDTFALPPEAVLFASTEACAHQAFLWKDRLLGLQFHLEMTPEGIDQLIEHCGADLGVGLPTVESSPAALRDGDRYFAGCRKWLGLLLERLFPLEPDRRP
jgi:GMP synthase-like glutamine amidotransferase